MRELQGEDGFLLVHAPERERAVVAARDEHFFVDHGDAVHTAFKHWVGCFVGFFDGRAAAEDELRFFDYFPETGGAVAGADADAAFLGEGGYVDLGGLLVRWFWRSVGEEGRRVWTYDFILVSEKCFDIC